MNETDLADYRVRMKGRMARAGQLLRVDSGEYSDYQVRGFFVVLEDFSPLAKLDHYLATRPEEKLPYRFKAGMFLAWLACQGLLLDIPYGRLYLSAYSHAIDEDPIECPRGLYDSGVRFTPATMEGN